MTSRLARMTHTPAATPYEGRTVDDHATHVAQALDLRPDQAAALTTEINSALLAPYAALRHAAQDADVHLALGAERLLKVSRAVATRAGVAASTTDSTPHPQDALDDALAEAGTLRAALVRIRELTAAVRVSDAEAPAALVEVRELIAHLGDLLPAPEVVL